MSETRVCEVETRLIVGGKKEYPAKLQLKFGINDYAKANIDFPPTNVLAHSAAMDMTSADVAHKMGTYQQMVYEDRPDPDSILQVRVKGDASFRTGLMGMMMSPTFAFSPNQVLSGAGILDKFAVIDLARFAIYEPEPVSNYDNDLMAFGKLCEDCEWDIPMTWYYMMEDMVNKGDESGAFEDENVPDEDKRLRIKQHELNKKCLPIIKELCERSTKFGWKATLSKLTDEGLKGQTDTHIRECLYRHLAAGRGSFLSTIAAVCEDFQCFLYCADENGTTKYEMRNRFYAMDNPHTLTVPIQSLTAATGSGNGIFPTRYVVTVVKSPKSYYDASGAAATSFFGYPEKNMQEGGTAIPVSPPTWMASILSNIEMPKSGDTPAAKGLTRTKAKTRLKKLKKKLKSRRVDAATILRQWLRTYYRWVALGTSQATVTMPMIKKVQAGERYLVKNASGKTLFRGFASNVSYNLQTGSGSSNSATVYVLFTHVEFGDFNLPE